jgi:NAD(P)-dependent dehydrogenase (short-subunit alcohol dehydrogenase family)
MDLGLAGKVAVVTGASKGIGLAVTRALVAEGARVAAGARNPGALAELDGVHPVTVDLTAPDGPARLVEEAVATFGRVDILVNNVGAVHPRLDGFLAVTDADWEATLTVNFLSAVRTTRAALPHLLAAAPSTIVTVSSVNAFLPDPGVIDYCAAKAALSNFCKALSKEVGPRGVRVNTVSPGPVETDLWLGDHGVAATVGGANASDPRAVVEQVAATTSTGRFTRPDEVADLVVLLAGSRGANVTGSDILIDGGLVQTL